MVGFADMHFLDNSLSEFRYDGTLEWTVEMLLLDVSHLVSPVMALIVQ